MSFATSLLKQLGFYDKFEENRTSQYIGYRLKNRVKGSKRYQLILAQRKEGLCISIPINFFESELLRLKGVTEIYQIEPFFIPEYSLVSRLWVLPSKEDVFLSNLSPKYSEMFGGDTTGSFTFKYYDDDCDMYFTMSPEDFDIETLADSSTYLLVQEDKLFPYAWQVSINSSEVLKEFLPYFAKIIMEAQ